MCLPPFTGHRSEGTKQQGADSPEKPTSERDGEEYEGDSKNSVIEQGDWRGGNTGQDLSEEMTFDLRTERGI